MKPLKDIDDLPATSEIMIKRNVRDSDQPNRFADKSIMHKKLVFADKEFTHPLLKLVVDYDLVGGSMNISKFIKGTRKYANVSFTDKKGKKVSLSESEVALINNLASEFAVLPEDATSYMVRAQNSKAALVDRVALAYRPGMGLYLKIGEGATKEEIDNAVKDISSGMFMAYGVPLAKRTKPPQNYELVYAIFKARNANRNFKEIYQLYMDGNLPGYKGSKSLSTLEKFREYYNKFRPDNPL